MSLDSPTNRLVVVALNSRGEPVANAPKEVLIGPIGPLAIHQEGGDLVIEYPVWRTGLHRLQTTVFLVNADWQTIAEESANSGTVQFRIPAPPMPSAFYRLVEP